MRLKKVICCLLSTLLVMSVLIPSSSALSKQGSRGDEVTQIQQKLKNWGYYTRFCRRDIRPADNCRRTSVSGAKRFCCWDGIAS